MTQIKKSRNPWLAAFLSLLHLGLGHFYCGKFRKALFLFSFQVFFSLSAFFLGLFSFNFFGFLVFLLVLYIAIRIFVIVDAYRLAKISSDFVLTRFNKLYIYALAFRKNSKHDRMNKFIELYERLKKK